MKEDWKEEFIRLLYPIDTAQMNIEKAYELKYRNIPNFLYKYQEFDEEGHSLENIEKDQLWLSCPENFDDACDCAAKHEVTLDHFQNMKERYLDGLRKVGQYTEDEIEQLRDSKDIVGDSAKLATIKDKKLPNDFPEIMKIVITEALQCMSTGLSEDFTRRIKSDAYVACFSELSDSPLMWGLYSKKNTGFCVEYCFSELHFSDLLTRMLYPVIYTDELLNLTEYDLPPKKRTVS